MAVDTGVTAATTTAPGGEHGAEIVARASTEYRVKRYIMVLIMVLAGAWFGLDGFVRWPKETAKFDDLTMQIEQAERNKDNALATRLVEERKNYTRRGFWDILFQRVLCFVLPPAGLALLVWSLYNSRGEYRLAGQTLHVPGHPPVPFTAIRRLDKTKWDKKGIAYVDYDDPKNGEVRRLRLDDFIYERRPTDDIYKRVDEYVMAQAG